MIFRLRAATLVLALVSGCAGRDAPNAAALEASGLAHRSKGEYDLALADFERAIALEPTRATAHFNRGFIYQIRNDFPRAVSSFDEALRLKPDLALALRNRGRVHFYLGNFRQSAADLEAGLRQDPTNGFVVVWLHIARARMGSADSSALAAQVAQTDTTLWPTPIARLYQGAITLEQLADSLKRGDQATQQIKRCGAAFYVAEYLLWRGKRDDALARFREAESICPKDYSEYQGSVAELARIASSAAR